MRINNHEVLRCGNCPSHLLHVAKKTYENQEGVTLIVLICAVCGDEWLGDIDTSTGPEVITTTRKVA